MMRSNPPIKGHELIGEGHSWPEIDPVTGDYKLDVSGQFIRAGGCRCGAKPDDWPNVSVAAVKRWHRLHKDEMRWRS